MNKQEKLEHNIYNNIEVVATITCTKCKKFQDFHSCDDWSAVEAAINKGWYATENNCYCPNCQSKRK